MSMLSTALLSAILSGTVLATILGVLFQRRAATIQAAIKMEFDAMAATAGTQRVWRERAVAELLGPVFMQLDRTERAFRRWSAHNAFIEAKVIREGNLVIRDLLLAKPHLVPPDLLTAAGALVEHYDRWLEEFDRVRSAERPDLDTPFVFVGPKGHPFPRAEANMIQARYHELWRSLYGPAT
jgi:hypothetical protein